MGNKLVQVDKGQGHRYRYSQKEKHLIVAINKEISSIAMLADLNLTPVTDTAIPSSTHRANWWMRLSFVKKLLFGSIVDAKLDSNF